MKDTAQNTRRDFLVKSGALTAGMGLASVAPQHVHAAEDNTIKIGLVGCGGRGTGAVVQALSTEGPTQLHAVGDVFEDRMNTSVDSVKTRLGEKGTVPKDRQFLGFDAYKKVVDAVGPGGVVLLTTPPAFRPMHLEYAVEQGCHVFMEKSFGVDPPGVRRVLAAGEKAKEKNLKIAGGLMEHHRTSTKEVVAKIHDGAIGDITSIWAYRVHGPVRFRPKADGESELAHQIRNFNNFTWGNGAFILDWMIHNLDLCLWAKQMLPVSARAQGGRGVRTEQDQLFDHCAIEYTFPDGTRLMAQGNHRVNCWNCYENEFVGTKGTAVFGYSVRRPVIYDGHLREKAHVQWQHSGEEANRYQIEHDILFRAIREDTVHNETQRCADAAMASILGRMAMDSGRELQWDDALASDVSLAPELDKLTSLDDPAPVVPDEDGNYPIAQPGFTKVM